MHMHRITSLVMSVALLGLSAAVSAADFPSKDIRIIVPWAPGGGVDTTSRILAEYASKALESEGVEVVVENRTGGGGVVGQSFGANADPDGYTVLAATSSIVTNPKVKQVQYELSDFQPVALYNIDPEVLAVPAGSEYETITDLAAAASAQELTMTLASPGTSHHMAALALMHRSDLQFNLLHMDDYGQQVQSLLGGHVKVALWPLGEAERHIEAGTVHPLAVSSLARLEDYPDLPTWQESDFGVKEFVTFRGWAVPAGTPEDVVQYLSELLRKVSENPAYRKAMANAGYRPVYRDTAGFTAVIENYDEVTSEIIDTYGLAAKN